MLLNLTSGSKKILLYTIVLLLIIFPAVAKASDKKQVKNIRYWSSPEYTRIVVDLSELAEYSKGLLSDPERLYFNLRDTVLAEDIKTNISVHDGILKMIRAGQFSSDTVRVVLDLETISDFHIFVLDNPARLVVDVYGKEKQGTDTFITKRRIVIDPGHGGHDPGAIGPKDLYEKNVVLDIAHKLKKILSEDPLNEIFLTRDRDIFVPLEERTAIANKKQADLFVSIHANASPRTQARGIETYLLNWTDDEEAMRVAARENAISFKKMKEMHRQMDTVKVITDDLMRQTKRDESIKLAHYIQKSMISTLVNSNDLGVKQALFYVLFGARMPSVLVEVSFISNSQEEKLLSQNTYRMEVAKAIAEGIKTYFTSAPAFQKVAELNNKKL